jgi:NADH-quinone oxidoreductase subunit N
MLAYSSITHAGYALVGFVAGAATTPEDRSAALSAVAFYLLTYAIMNMGAFAVVTLIARRGDQQTTVDDYNGIGFASPILAFSLSLFLLSLLGMPLTAGFMGKIFVFSSALKQGYTWLVVIGVLNTAISAYYYLRLIIVMFFRERTGTWELPRVPASVAIALVLTILGVFYLVCFPAVLQRIPGKAHDFRSHALTCRSYDSRLRSSRSDKKSARRFMVAAGLFGASSEITDTCIPIPHAAEERKR